MLQTDSGSTRLRSLSPLTITLIYLVVSVIWIVFSDRFVAMIVSDPGSIASLQTFKGLGFVVITAALLFFLIRSSMSRLRRSNQLLKQAEEKLRVMFDALTQGVVVTDLNGKIVEFNPAAFRMSCLDKPAELFGMSIYDFFTPESHSELTAGVRHTIREGESGVIEHDIIRPDGTSFPARYSSALLKGTEGSPWGIVTLLEDVSERRKHTEKIVYLNRVLSLIRDINQLIVQEEEETALLAKACRRTVQHPDYNVAWIALADTDGLLQPAVHAGELADYERCLQEFGSERVEDIHPVVRASYADSLLATAISMPLIVHNQVIGAFSICSANAQAFADQEEFDLIEEVSQDLSLGIEKIRKRAEAARHLAELARRNQFIETVTDNLPIGLAVNAPDQPFEYINRQFEAIYGWPAAIISDVTEFFKHVYPDPEYRHKIQQRIMSDINSGDPERMVWENIPIVHQDGSEHVISAINIPLPEQNLMISTVWDVTDRNRAQQDLALRARLLDASLDSIFVVEAGSRKFKYFNEQAHKSLGYTQSEFMDLTLDKIVAPENLSALPQNISRVLEQNSAVFETVHHHKDGHNVPVEIHAQKVDINGQTFMMGLARDITDRKAMQEKLIITDRLASVGELAAGIAHEINNPLTGVLGFAELLKEKTLPADIREDVNTIYSEAQRTVKVVRNMLTFARRHEAFKRPTQLNDVLTETFLLRAYEHKVNNIEVVLHLSPELPEIKADPAQMQQVFLNIIINAEYVMRESRNGGRLTVATEVAGSKIRVTLANTGPAISPEQQKHLFDPFFTTKPEGQGTGLGLSIVYGIVTSHGGTVRVKSAEGQDTAFIIELPLDPTVAAVQ
ncbi:MAG: PAS domain S-box protein [Dehalogenimonas sp.]|uniref:histidine kinase n=1 Tax=Candidatus Dehalogenimonas loeffleri TaxID=3127115 RepID=A0ABZ2J9N0_9CHLR|nr:PAS domain S-box protein [Dehalogenimonas sp.]